MACITCFHDEPHNGGGIGVCAHPDCGCDGPVTEADKIEADQRWIDWGYGSGEPVASFEFDTWRVPAAIFAGIVVMALLVLFAMDSVTNHEPPADLPDCGRDEVLLIPGDHVTGPGARPTCVYLGFGTAANLPDCEEDELLDYIVYDSDPAKRIYKCVHAENVNP